MKESIKNSAKVKIKHKKMKIRYFVGDFAFVSFVFFSRIFEKQNDNLVIFLLHHYDTFPISFQRKYITDTAKCSNINILRVAKMKRFNWLSIICLVERKPFQVISCRISNVIWLQYNIFFRSYI